MGASILSKSILILWTGLQLTHAAEKSIGDLKASSATGDAVSQLELARAYLYGHRGLEIDAKEALAWTKRAADQKLPDAVAGMGYFYAEGVAVPRNATEAFEWFQQGADLGSARAQLNLGLAYAGGCGTEKNEAKALDWIIASARQEFPEAQAKLAEFIYTERLNLKRDDAEVLRHALPAAEAGNPIAQNIMGVLYQYGRGVKSERKMAEMWYRRAALQGDVKAQSNLAFLMGTTNPKTQIESISWLLRAEGEGDVAARKTLNQLRSGLPPEVIQAAKEKASEPLAPN